GPRVRPIEGDAGAVGGADRDAVAGDQVPRALAVPDRELVREVDADAVAVVALGGSAVGVRPDPVAEDPVLRAVADVDAVPGAVSARPAAVGRDDVSGGRAGAADKDVR